MRTDMSRGIAAVLVLAGLLAGPAAAQDKLNIPPFETATLSGGLTVQLLRHPTVPMVTLDLLIPAGAAFDPAGKEGLANLTAEMLRKGAGGRDAIAFAQAVDQLGATFETGVNHDRVRIRMTLLAKDVDAGLALFADAVLRPRFDDAEVTKLAAQLAEGVVQAKDNPRNVLNDYYNAFLYGDHPYANPVGGTETSLPTITAADVKGFYTARFGVDGAVLTVAGDFDAGAMKGKLDKALGGMKPSAERGAPIPEPAKPAAQRVLLVNKNDTPQTWFMIGGLGPAMGQPDFAATELVRTVFGGRFTSWLNTKLRIESGLTYGARFNIARRSAAGTAAISSFTATETTREAIDLALAQLDRLHQEGLSEEELASAKAYFKGQTPYDYETAADLAGALSELTFYGITREQLDELFARVDAVTLEDCKNAVAKYFGRENLVFATVGVAETVKDILGGYGDLTIRENSAPGFR